MVNHSETENGASVRMQELKKLSDDLITEFIAFENEEKDLDIKIAELEAELNTKEAEFIELEKFVIKRLEAELIERKAKLQEDLEKLNKTASVADGLTKQ